MRYGLCTANVGSYADPRKVVRLAEAAEAAGWEALFIWDHLAWVWDGPSADPWTTLAAAGARTERLLLGTAVTPVARRRPHVLANQLATLDELTGGGRVLLGAGLGGVEREFTEFGEDGDPKHRARLLDEGLERVRELLTGPLGPREIPIWIGGNSAPARRRAARHEGWLPDTADLAEMKVSPEQLADWVAGARPGDRPWDVCVTGYSQPAEADVFSSYEQAGATWWLETIHDRRAPFEELLDRVNAGP
jgi:alkanesulfonate monooxygenase SsuD/methylene tetrahydromethanopterin reductase-like flavin-dependent oxidoreductase (luciferase family)